MGWERPFYGVAMWTFMLGAAGFPLTGGMLGKLYVFSAAYDRGWWWLVVVGVVATLVSLYYYLGVVRVDVHAPGPSEHGASQGGSRGGRLAAARSGARARGGRVPRRHGRVLRLHLAARPPSPPRGGRRCSAS